VKATETERQLMREFSEFIDSEPASPGMQVEDAIMRRVAKDLKPVSWKIYGKVFLIEIAGGLATLTLCPQFGLGFGRHDELLHALHSLTPPPLFYLICGLIFVSIGALLSAMLLTRSEVRTMNRSKYAYFIAYSLLVYSVLVVFGAESFLLSSLTWMVGAILGNLLGFEAVSRIRTARSS